MMLPDTMHAMVLTGHGGFDKLEFRTDFPTPRPAPGEIVVRVAACGLNSTDINTRTAWYASDVTVGINDHVEALSEVSKDNEKEDGGWDSPIRFPLIQGADVAGTVAALGDGVEGFEIGQRVMIYPWLLGVGDWRDPRQTGYFGSECNGGFAQFTRVPAANVYPIHTSLSDAELATFACAYTTAENLVGRTALQPGETVVITGASGGVGSAAIQLCRLRGARVIAIAGAAKGDALRALGAEAVIDRHEPNLEEAILAAAGGPVDVALDVVGATMFAPLISALRHWGRYSTSGCIAGPLAEFDLRLLILKDLQLTGATIVPPGTMRRLVSMIEKGQLKPLLAQTFPLHQLVEAQKAFLAKQHVGNIVVECWT